MTEPQVNITLDDVRNKALRVKDMTETELRHVKEQQASKVVLVGALAIFSAISLAYYIGTRRR